jgi:hypothetical protein
MPRVRFEPTIPVFARPKTCHALDRAVTVIGSLITLHCKNKLVYETVIALKFDRI